MRRVYRPGNDDLTPPDGGSCSTARWRVERNWSVCPTMRTGHDRHRLLIQRRRTVKLTVIGRPGTVVERGDVVLVVMRSEKAPALPKGVPAPPSPQTDYMVLIGMKQV